MLLPADSLITAHTIEAEGNDTETLGYVNRIAALIKYHKNKTLSLAAHDDVVAQSTMKGSTGKGIFKNVESPIPTIGFPAGSLCSEGEECMSGVCEQETGFSWYRCVGVECKEDFDCDSGRCDSGECAPRLGSCQPCDEDSDCARFVWQLCFCIFVLV